MAKKIEKLKYKITGDINVSGIAYENTKLYKILKKIATHNGMGLTHQFTIDVIDGRAIGIKGYDWRESKTKSDVVWYAEKEAKKLIKMLKPFRKEQKSKFKQFIQFFQGIDWVLLIAYLGFVIAVAFLHKE